MFAIDLKGLERYGDGELQLPEEFIDALEEAFGRTGIMDVRDEEGQAIRRPYLRQTREGYALVNAGALSPKAFAQATGSELILTVDRDSESYPNLIFGAASAEEAEARSLAVVTKEGQAHIRGASFKLPADNKAFAAALREALPPPLPGLNCGRCDWGSCPALLEAMMRGEGRYEDCVARPGPVEVAFDGQSIGLVPFVARTVANVVDGMAREMKGYEEPQTIELTVHRDE